MKAKKSLGQNFLRDPKILKKIADFADLKKEDTVVEVGPGEGTLTKILLEKAKRVIAVEKDEQLAELLKEKFHQEIIDNRLEIIEGDILELRAESLELRGKENSSSKLEPLSYKLIGNIPYYITGVLFKKALESENQPKSITFVVQKEVAKRILAKDDKESILSISIKAYGRPELGGIIKAGSFYPKPKVDSGIIAVRDISKKSFEGITHPNPLSARTSHSDGLPQERGPEKKFFEILKAGFAHKRKLLKKNLGYPNLDKVFEKCWIPENARAEDLKVEDWLCLTKEIN